MENKEKLGELYRMRDIYIKDLEKLIAQNKPHSEEHTTLYEIIDRINKRINKLEARGSGPIYCGIRKPKKGQRLGNARECIKNAQARRWGKHLIPTELLELKGLKREKKKGATSTTFKLKFKHKRNSKAKKALKHLNDEIELNTLLGNPSVANVLINHLNELFYEKKGVDLEEAIIDTDDIYRTLMRKINRR